MPNNMNLEPMLTVDDLANVLGVPKATVYKWRYDGDGPIGYRVGRHVRYHWADVEQWLADQRDARGGPNRAA